MAFEVVGKLYRKFDTESKSEKFQVREFVIETMDGNYAQFIKFQLAQERCPLIDGYTEGEDIKVHFDLRGREWQGKFFTSLNCWRLEKSDGTEAVAAPQAAQKAAAPKAPSTPAPVAADSFPTLADEPLKAADTDDLPF